VVGEGGGEREPCKNMGAVMWGMIIKVAGAPGAHDVVF